MPKPAEYNARETVRVSFAITQEVCADILTAAVESGVYGSQWLRDFDASADYAPDGGPVVRVTLKNGQPGTECAGMVAKHKTVTLRSIAAALGAMLSDSDAGTRWTAGECLGENLDGPRADCVVQFAVFGAIVFG